MKKYVLLTMALALVAVGLFMLGPPAKAADVAPQPVDAMALYQEGDQEGCLSCHEGIESIREEDSDMMKEIKAKGECTACHGGDPTVTGEASDAEAAEAAHTGAPDGLPFDEFFPDPGSVSEKDRTRYNRVYWHTLGTPQAEDVLVYERPDANDLAFYPTVTEDGRYLILHVYRGTDPRNRVYYREVESEGPFVRLLDEADASYEFIDNTGPVFYFLTDRDAPRYRIIAIFSEKQLNWETLRELSKDNNLFHWEKLTKLGKHSKHQLWLEIEEAE